MDECPCKDCIVLSMCRGMMEENGIKFLLNIRSKCSLYEQYVVTKVSGKNVHINMDHAIEAGKYLGYTIDGRVVKTNVESKQNEEVPQAE